MFVRALVIAVVAGWVLAGCTTVAPETESKGPIPGEQHAAANPEALPPAAQALPPAAQAVPDGSPIPGSTAAKTLAQEYSLHALELLEDGNEAAARSELERALALDPNSSLARNLMRQIVEDPVALLGSQSFPYSVGRGESLSRISQRFLGDALVFYALARYNGIAVPRQLREGQVIKVPGKPLPAFSAAAPTASSSSSSVPDDRASRTAQSSAAAPSAVASTAPAVEARDATVSPPAQLYASAIAAEQRGDFEQAYRAYTQVVNLDPSYRDTSARAEKVRAELVRRHHREATAAFHKQDLDTAIREWDRVLELDPTNETAKLNRQRALDLSRRIQQIK